MVCNLTYETAHVLDYSKINNIISVNNLSESWTTVRAYMDCWQDVCSDLLNLSLFEPIVCNETGKFLEENPRRRPGDALNLKKILGGNITISSNLAGFYLDNYKPRCLGETVSIIEKTRDMAWILFVIIMFCFIVIVSNHNNKKKKVISIIDRLSGFLNN